ncbi:MAG: hypothetical protein ACRDNF_19435 [Streptosporangiaceae bacterium]
MNGADVTDGNSEEVARGGSEEEAAWLELIGRFDAPADSPDSPAPWPEREDLSASGPGGASSAGEKFGVHGSGEKSGTGEPGEAAGAADGPGSGGGPSAADGPGADEGLGAGHGVGPGDGPAGGEGAATAGASPAIPWPERENLPPRTPGSPDKAPSSGGRPGTPVYRQFELPTPASPRSWTAPDNEEDEHYVPPPPPPLPNMSPVTKGAWAALFGGPAYLLVATLASWSVAGWALFLAIAAFVGGFTVLALRLGDHPDDDSGPDDGAVV